MKILLIALMTLSAVSFAAPTGHQICNDADHKFEFIFGTYVYSGDDGLLNVDNQSYDVAAQPGEGFGELLQKITVFCICEPPKGPKIADVKWDITSGEYSDPQSIHMTIKRIVDGKEKITDIDMNCKPKDFKLGNEQD